MPPAVILDEKKLYPIPVASRHDHGRRSGSKRSVAVDIPVDVFIRLKYGGTRGAEPRQDGQSGQA